MLNIVDFDFYEDEDCYFGDAITDEDTFIRIERKAENFLIKRCYGRLIKSGKEFGLYIPKGYAKEFIPFSKEELNVLRMGLCSLVEAMYKVERAEQQSLSGNQDSANIKSRSSGGESITYEAQKNAYTEAMTDKQKYNALCNSALMEYMNPYAFRYNPFYAGVY